MPLEKKYLLRDRLEKIKAARSLTWLEMADFIGVSRQYMSMLKSGERVPGPKIERRIRDAEEENRLQSAAIMPAVREAPESYGMTDTERLLLDLARENAGFKARLATLDERLRRLEGGGDANAKQG